MTEKNKNKNPGFRFKPGLNLTLDLLFVCRRYVVVFVEEICGFCCFVIRYIDSLVFSLKSEERQYLNSEVYIHLHRNGVIVFEAVVGDYGKYFLIAVLVGQYIEIICYIRTFEINSFYARL